MEQTGQVRFGRVRCEGRPDSAVVFIKNGDILLNGHTHIPANENMGTYTYMNPGSVAIPKNNSAHGYMLYDKGFLWKDLEGSLLNI